MATTAPYAPGLPHDADLRLRFAAVRAAGPTAISDLVGHSIDVSKENLGGHETPMPLRIESSWDG